MADVCSCHVTMLSPYAVALLCHLTLLLWSKLLFPTCIPRPLTSCYNDCQATGKILQLPNDTAVETVCCCDIAGAHEQPSVSHQSHHSAWHSSKQHEAEGEAQSGYHGDEPFAGEEGVSSSSRASLSDSGYVCGPRPADRGRQRAVSVPRDRPNFRSTVPRYAQ